MGRTKASHVDLQIRGHSVLNKLVDIVGPDSETT